MKKILCFIFLIMNCSAQEIDLSLYETSIYSQHGEDGIIAKILTVIPCTSKYCVECGACDGVTGSSTFLLRRQGWRCLLLDRMFEREEFNLNKEFIRAENITEIFEKYRVPKDLDVLSIDIGYNDFHVWQKIDPKFSAKLVIIPCNPTHLPSVDKVVQYRPFYCGDGTNYYGASILALYHLGRSKGYSLVYHESSGTNLFFIKDTILEKANVQFKNVNDVEKLYRKVDYGNGPNGGKRADFRNRDYFTSIELIQ